MRIFLLVIALLFSACGMDEETSDPSIVNGKKSYRPWYAMAGGSCGATLITKRWLVSAKHCGNPQQAIVGLYRIGDPNNGGKPKVDKIKIIKIIKHPRRDLQLLKLERGSIFRPIPVYRGGLISGDRLEAFGFGNTEYKGKAPEFLQAAEFFYSGEGSREGIIRASNRPNQAVCHGDSGGPLVFRGKLVANITFTEGRCSVKGSMGFTRLDVEWIRRNTD